MVDSILAAHRDLAAPRIPREGVTAVRLISIESCGNDL
jgi:hypothetical protein